MISQLLDGAVSCDRITRILSESQTNFKDLWLTVKSLVWKYKNDNACLIFDNSIIEKLYTTVVNWFGGTAGNYCEDRNIKVSNLLSAFYHTEGRN